MTRPTPSAALRSMLAAAVLCAAATAQAQVTVRDAVTGELRAPTAAEVQQLQMAAQLRDRANRGVLTGKLNPQPVRMQGNEDMLEHTEGMMNYSVVVREADGTLTQKCLADLQTAERVARGERTAFAKTMWERRNAR